MMTMTMTADRAIAIARIYDPSIRTAEDAIAYWRERAQCRTIASAEDADGAMLALYADLAMIDVAQVRALESRGAHGV
jgi:hypothetical protein